MMNRLFTLTLVLLTASSAFAFQDDSNVLWSDSVVQTESDGPSILIIPMQGQMHTDIHN